MNTEDLSRLPEHVRMALPAMRRASELARKTAIQTDTALVLVREGQRVTIPAAELQRMANHTDNIGQEAADIR